MNNVIKPFEYLYTKGNEFSLNGVEYIGEYHMDSDMLPKTGPTRGNTSALVLGKYYSNIELYIYDTVTKENVVKYGGPVSKVNIPTRANYELGEYNRYFVYRVNEPNPVFYEIDLIEYGRYGKEGGIDSVLYGIITLPWKIRGDSEYVVNMNYSAVVELATKYNVPGFIDSIVNFAKYHK